MPPAPRISIIGSRKSVSKCPRCRGDKKKCLPLPTGSSCIRCSEKGFECSGLSFLQRGPSTRRGPNSNLTATTIHLNQHRWTSQESTAYRSKARVLTPAPTRVGAQMGAGFSDYVASERIGLQKENSPLYQNPDRAELSTAPCTVSQSQINWNRLFRAAKRRWGVSMRKQDDRITEFYKTLRIDFQSAQRMKTTKRYELAEAICRRIRYGAYQARSRDDFGSLYFEATLLLSDILVLEFRLDEAEGELRALLKEKGPNWDERAPEIHNALDSILGHEDMGFMGTGLTLEELVLQSSPDEWQIHVNGSLFDCIRKHSFNSTMQLKYFRLLLLKALKEDRLDVIESCSFLIRTTPELQHLGDFLLPEFIAASIAERQYDDEALKDRMLKDNPSLMQRTLRYMLEHGRPLDEVLVLLGPGSTMLEYFEDSVHAELLIAILEFERVDVLCELLNRGLGPKVHSSEILSQDSLPVRPWLKAILERRGNFNFYPSNMLEVACLAGQAGIVKVLLQHGDSRLKHYLVAMIRAALAHNLLHSAIVGGNHDVLRILVDFFRQVDVVGLQHCLINAGTSWSDSTDVASARFIVHSGSFTEGGSYSSPQGSIPTPITSEATEQSINGLSDPSTQPTALAARTHQIINLTPLHVAALVGSIKAVKILLEHGANPELTDSEGRIPLFYAALEHPQNYELIQVLTN